MEKREIRTSPQVETMDRDTFIRFFLDAPEETKTHIKALLNELSQKEKVSREEVIL